MTSFARFLNLFDITTKRVIQMRSLVGASRSVRACGVLGLFLALVVVIGYGQVPTAPPGSYSISGQVCWLKLELRNGQSFPYEYLVFKCRPLQQSTPATVELWEVPTDDAFPASPLASTTTRANGKFTLSGQLPNWSLNRPPVEVYLRVSRGAYRTASFTFKIPGGVSGLTVPFLQQDQTWKDFVATCGPGFSQDSKKGLILTAPARPDWAWDTEDQGQRARVYPGAQLISSAYPGERRYLFPNCVRTPCRSKPEDVTRVAFIFNAERYRIYALGVGSWVPGSTPHQCSWGRAPTDEPVTIGVLPCQ